MPKLAHAYPPYWQQLAHYVKFEREKGICQHCGQQHGHRRNDLPQPIFSNEQPTPAELVQLGCAHLNHDETDQRQDNLAALCRACHLRHDARDNHDRRRLNAIEAARQIALPSLF